GTHGARCCRREKSKYPGHRGRDGRSPAASTRAFHSRACALVSLPILQFRTCRYSNQRALLNLLGIHDTVLTPIHSRSELPGKDPQPFRFHFSRSAVHVNFDRLEQWRSPIFPVPTPAAIAK